MMNKKLIRKALEIAARDLRSCYGKNGIYAGARQFRDYWSWDSFFASLGALELGDYKIVKKNLRLFLSHQRTDGLIPFRIGAYDYIKKYVLNILFKKKIHFPQKARYIDERHVSHPLTSNSTLVIAVRACYEKTRDKRFIKKNFIKIKKALDWVNLQDKNKDLLVEERYFANWLDNVKKAGTILFTNVCHYKAIFDFSELCRDLDKIDLYKKYGNLAQKIKEKINKVFWNGRYYSDWIDTKGKKRNYFASDGNLLAVLWNIADRKQTKLINGYMTKKYISMKDFCRTSWPFYKKRMVPIALWFINMINYQRKFLWSWLASIDVLEKYQNGEQKLAWQKLENLSKIIIEYNGIYEIYEETRKPVQRWLYKAEQPFAWGAGLFIYTCSKMNIKV